jgi:GTP-binding protein Era
VSGDDRRATRCGFVAIVGAPNAGKSTLVNTLVGAKVSIVTPKVQTTRTRILGILGVGGTQLVFIDTPGIFAPRRRLDRAMVAAAWGGAADADEVVMLVDAAAGFDDDARRIVAGLKEAGRSAVLALNKIDLGRREALLGLSAELNASGIFTDTFMISATTGDGVDDLVRTLAARAPEAPWHFPEDQLSDMNERLFAAEVTREKLFLQLRQEVPYALTVETDGWEEFQDGSVKIDQTVYLAREAHKAIVLGKGGARIKAVREAARQELEAHWGRRVHLFVFVAVRENWGDDPERYRAWGLDFEA